MIFNRSYIHYSYVFLLESLVSTKFAYLLVEKESNQNLNNKNLHRWSSSNKHLNLLQFEKLSSFLFETGLQNMYQLLTKPHPIFEILKIYLLLALNSFSLSVNRESVTHLTLLIKRLLYLKIFNKDSILNIQ